MLNSKRNNFKVHIGGAGKMANALALDSNSITTMRSARVTKFFEQEDELLSILRQSGQKLNSTLDITDEDINYALKELRKECWK